MILILSHLVNIYIFALFFFAFQNTEFLKQILFLSKNTPDILYRIYYNKNQ